jgi:pyridoxamine 5'-phosphate oxidase
MQCGFLAGWRPVSTSRDDEIRARLRSLAVFSGELPVFDVQQAPAHPALLFWRWLAEAIDADVREPHAMTLSTIDAQGRPTARVLILKGLDDGRWQFASSRTSRKGIELAATPWAAATFYWSELGRQVRLRGRVLDAGVEAGARDFLARSEGSRAETLAGNQSQVLPAAGDLDAALEDARARIAADPQLTAEDWALYHLIPDEIEFWQADRDRRHVRLRYLLHDTAWKRDVLWP